MCDQKTNSATDDPRGGTNRQEYCAGWSSWGSPRPAVSGEGRPGIGRLGPDAPGNAVGLCGPERCVVIQIDRSSTTREQNLIPVLHPGPQRLRNGSPKFEKSSGLPPVCGELFLGSNRAGLQRFVFLGPPYVLFEDQIS